MIVETLENVDKDHRHGGVHDHDQTVRIEYRSTEEDRYSWVVKVFSISSASVTLCKEVHLLDCRIITVLCEEVNPGQV